MPLKRFDSYMQAGWNDDASMIMLHGLVDADCSHVAVAKIDVTEPARIGVGVAQNWKIRKQAAALSVLIPLLLDRDAVITDELVEPLCKLVRSKRPAKD